jgi:hypothetical protein
MPERYAVEQKHASFNVPEKVFNFIKGGFSPRCIFANAGGVTEAKFCRCTLAEV